jgi:hypothetical protein
VNVLTLDPKDDIVSQIIKSYEGYAATLSSDKRKQFNEMLRFLYDFVAAIGTKSESFAEEAAIVSLVLKQHIIIEELKIEVDKLKQRRRD